MAEPQTIPSKVNKSSGLLTAPDGDRIYITAILIDSNLIIDGATVSSPGPVSLPSPIICTSVSTTSVGQIAYFVR